MTTPDYESLYNSLLENLEAAGLDVASLTKGDESTTFRSADDVIRLAEFLKSQAAISSGASIRTVARNVRPTA